MRSTRHVLITVIAIAMAGCGTWVPANSSDQGPLLRETGGVASGASGSGRAGGAPEASSSPNTAAFNRRLMEQAARSSGRTPICRSAPGDLLEVSVFEVEELSRIRLRVPHAWGHHAPADRPDPGGRSHDLRAGGRDPFPTQRKFMHDPQVSVFLQEHNSQRISVIGAVRKGGVFNLNRPLRLADALALAEGLTDEADRLVYVIRRAPISRGHRDGGRRSRARRSGAAVGAGTRPPR